MHIDFDFRFKDYNDKELMKLYQIAIETRYGKYIKAIKEEMFQRTREAR